MVVQVEKKPRKREEGMQKMNSTRIHVNSFYLKKKKNLCQIYDKIFHYELKQSWFAPKHKMLHRIMD